ncbi:MAG: type IIL restriction-modification enzyme MmeI [Kiritimatiellia bacterium]
MRARRIPPDQVAHFLDRVVFCQFAEDIGLLPDQIFTRILDKSGGEPVKFARFLAQLFDAMSTGGEFGLETIRHFNGSLFDDETVPELTGRGSPRIAETARLDWSAVDPSIFGTPSNAASTPPNAPSLARTSPAATTSKPSSKPWSWRPLRREWAETEEIVTRVLATGRKTPGRVGTSSGSAGKVWLVPGDPGGARCPPPPQEGPRRGRQPPASVPRPPPVGQGAR